MGKSMTINAGGANQCGRGGRYQVGKCKKLSSARLAPTCGDFGDDILGGTNTEGEACGDGGTMKQPKIFDEVTR